MELLLELELFRLPEISELLVVSEIDVADVVICDEAVVVPGDEPPPQPVSKQESPNPKMRCVRVITVGSALVLYYFRFLGSWVLGFLGSYVGSGEMDLGSSSFR